MELRQAYSKRFIPPRSFWNDRISAEEQSDIVAIAEAYKEALALHPHISIAVQYVKVMTEAHEDGKLVIITYVHLMNEDFINSRLVE